MLGDNFDDRTALRFWSKIRPTPSGCWEWMGGKSQSGYGRFKIGDVMVHPHRLAFEMAFGPVPEGRECCHTCPTKGCVNPLHIYAGTRRDNVRDSVRAGICGLLTSGFLYNKGENNFSAKLNAREVMEIRRLRSSGTPVRLLAKSFGVCETAVRKILNGKAWTHVV